MKSRYKVVDKDGFYLVSSTIIEWIPIFIDEDAFRIIINSLKFCQERKGLQIYNYVIMPNHFHLIIHAEEITEIMQSIKRHTAKEIIEYLKNSKKEWLLNQLHFFKQRNKFESQYQVWQEGFHPQIISSYEMLDQKIQYIHQNPVKKGFVNNPENWKYSSACNKDFEGKEILKLSSLDDL